MPVREWLAAFSKAAFGLVVLLAVVPKFAGHPLLAGWLGMWGLILLLHFGLFHLLSLTYRLLGIDASPMMRQPVPLISMACVRATR